MQHGILLGNTKLQYDSQDKNTLTKFTVFVDSDFAGGPVSRKTTTRLVTLESLTPLSVGEAECHAAMKAGQVGLSSRSIFHGSGNSNES